MKTIFFVFILLLNFSCAIVRTDYKMLPIANHIEVENKELTHVEVYNELVPPKKPHLCFVSFVASGNNFSKDSDLLEKLKELSFKHKAPVLITSSSRKEMTSTMSTYLGSGIYVNDPINSHVMRGFGCQYSKVELGLIYDDDGTITYVKAGAIAAGVGLKEGMKLIAINGRPVPGDRWTVPIELLTKKPGDEVKIEYLDLSKTKKSIDLKL